MKKKNCKIFTELLTTLRSLCNSAPHVSCTQCLGQSRWGLGLPLEPANITVSNTWAESASIKLDSSKGRSLTLSTKDTLNSKQNKNLNK